MVIVFGASVTCLRTMVMRDASRSSIGRRLTILGIGMFTPFPGIITSVDVMSLVETGSEMCGLSGTDTFAGAGAEVFWRGVVEVRGFTMEGVLAGIGALCCIGCGIEEMLGDSGFVATDTEGAVIISVFVLALTFSKVGTFGFSVSPFFSTSFTEPGVGATVLGSLIGSESHG